MARKLIPEVPTEERDVLQALELIDKLDGRVSAQMKELADVPPHVRARIERLNAFTPHDNLEDVKAVRPDVVATIARMGNQSWSKDKTQLSILYRRALRALRDYGKFDPELHLSEGFVGQYLANHSGGLSIGSMRTHRSTLRLLRDGPPPPRELLGRSDTSAFYSPKEWDILGRAARLTGDFSDDAVLLTILAGHLGLRDSEITQAEPSWIWSQGDMFLITVPRSDGTFRNVPAFDEAGLALKAVAERGGRWVLRDHIVNRTNVINHLVKYAGRQNSSFANFSARRARNTWINSLLWQPIPYGMVAEIADLRGSTHLASDLLKEHDVPTDKQVVEALFANRVDQWRKP